MVTFCLIHGAWHGPPCWDPLIPLLERKGHATVAPELPLDDPEAGYEERIRPALAALDGLGEPTVVLGHSQSSSYATLIAAKQPPGLLVHLCPRLGGFDPPPGAPDPFRPGIPFPAESDDGLSSWDRDAAIAFMYERVPEDAARALADDLRPMAMPADDYPLREHPDVPTVLIYASDDEFFEPAWEGFMARELIGVEPIEIPGGHFPMAEDPDSLADLLDRLVAERWPENG